MNLTGLVDRLATCYGPAPEAYPTDPFDLVLWENVAYLANDTRRREAFDALRDAIGTRPDQILQASRDQLVAIAGRGIMAEHSATKMRKAAEIVLGEFDGDLTEVLSRPVQAAKRALRRFPGIGEPGAEKILLYTRSHPFLAPESNALRVLVRFGVCPAGLSYSATYRAAREAAERELDPDCDVLLPARYYLRRHGQEVCRNTTPQCEACVLRSACPVGGS